MESVHTSVSASLDVIVTRHGRVFKNSWQCARKRSPHLQVRRDVSLDRQCLYETIKVCWVDTTCLGFVCDKFVVIFFGWLFIMRLDSNTSPSNVDNQQLRLPLRTPSSSADLHQLHKLCHCSPARNLVWTRNIFIWFEAWGIVRDYVSDFRIIEIIE